MTTFDTKPLSLWHDLLGTDITQVIHADFYAYPTFNGNAEIGKLVAALQKNSLMSATVPTTPVMLYHSRTDDFVPYANVEAIHAKWDKSTIVELSSVGHVASGMEFMLKYMKLWDLIPM